MPGSSSSLQDVVRITRPPRPVHWRSWPLMDGGLTIWLWPPTVALFAWLTWQATGSLGWAMFVLVMLLICLWKMFVPVYYELNTEGVELRLMGHWRRLAWRKFDGWGQFPRGAVLHTRPAPDEPPDLLHGLYLPLSPSRRRIRDKALRALNYYLGPPSA